MYLIIVYNRERELARYRFADQRAQYNGCLGVLKAHPTATTWQFKDDNPKGESS